MPLLNRKPETVPASPTLQERIRRLPGAVLLALGYYASQASWPRRWL